MKEQKYLHNYWNQFDNMKQFQEFEDTLRGLKTMFLSAIYYLRDQCGYPWLQGRFIDSVEPQGGWVSGMLGYDAAGPYINVTVLATAKGQAIPERATLKLPGCLLWDFELYKTLAWKIAQEEKQRIADLEAQFAKAHEEIMARATELRQELESKNFSQETIDIVMEHVTKLKK